MTEFEIFYNLLQKDPLPGTKNRVFRINTDFILPGWIFDEEKDVLIGYKSANRKFSNIGLTSQIVYDILVLGLTDIKNRPKCPICEGESKFNKSLAKASILKHYNI